MKKTITIPTSQRDVKLEKYQEWAQAVERNKEKAVEHSLRIFVGLSPSEQKAVSVADLDEIYELVASMLTESHEIILRFKHNGIEYGFIPKIDDITMGEYIDAEKYLANVQDWHKFLAVVYRPITHTAGTTYDIEPYKGTGDRAEAFKHLPMSIMTGCSVFFYRLGVDLLADSPKSLRAVEKIQSLSHQHARRLLGIGDGTPRSMDLQMETS